MSSTALMMSSYHYLPDDDRRDNYAIHRLILIGEHTESMPQQPNLLLITTDQQRYDTVGAQAPSFLRTPHLDFLQRQGITFDSAYSSCPLCVPARTSIMSGESALSHGMRTNERTHDYIGHEETLPGRLGGLGYQTSLIGKTHFRPERTRHGFDETLPPQEYRKERRDSDGAYPRKHGLGWNEIYPGRSSVPEEGTMASWVVDECVEYIEERQDPTRPFMLWTSFRIPHPPLDPPEPYYSMYDDAPIPDPIESDWSDPEDLPPAIRDSAIAHCSIDDEETLRAARAAYYGMITQVDYNLGRLFGALEATGEMDDTLILFTSDHGEYIGDHGMQWKSFFHEPSSHVPFILRLPTSWEDRQAGATCGNPVQLADILPTFVSAAGGEPPADIDGRDLLPVARTKTDSRDYVVGTYGTEFNYLGLTDGDWKYIWYPDGPVEQLYHLTEDPDETTDLADNPEYEDKRQELNDALRNYVATREDTVLDGDELVSYPDGERTKKDDGTSSWEGFTSA